MPFVDISVLGDKQLQKNLKKLAVDVQQKITRKALRKAGKETLFMAKLKAPVRTFNLVTNISLSSSLKKKTGNIGVYVKTGTREKMGIPKSDKYYYPAYVELGTKKMSAKPYLRPAMEATRSSNTELIKKEIGNSINKLFKK